MKKFFVLSAAVLFCSTINAQFLGRIADAARNAAENAVQRNVERIVEDGVEKVFNPETGEYEPVEQDEERPAKKAAGWTCAECGTSGNTGKFCNECGAKKPEANGAWTCSECGTSGNTGKFCNECGAKKPGSQAAASQASAAASQAAAPAKKAVTTQYSKCDFVPGDEVFFEDPVEGEQIGEFPSKWDMLGGNSEVALLNGQQVIVLSEGGTTITPLMKEESWLGDVYTIEYDVWGTSDHGEDNQLPARYYLQFNNNMFFHIEWDANGSSYNIGWHNGTNGEYGYKLGSLTNLKLDEWNHVAISFNKRALKVYFNGERLVSVPNAQKAESFEITNDLWETRGYIKNVRIAKGAVPLYDRLMSDGKIITYAITFETGKADLKPESEVEIARIAKLMQDNPNLAFEVQGHCDSTGSDKVNDPLSQKRAEAIVAALVEKGIAAARLTAVGKGSHDPIASNSTDEGRAKNRRVEFVKQ